MLEAAKFSDLDNDREHMRGVSSQLENPRSNLGHLLKGADAGFYPEYCLST